MEILVIEDERSIASLVRLSLEKEGFVCSVAYDGKSGLQLFEQNAPDIVILDLNLPHMNGLDLCERIRLSARKDPLIMMLTAKATEGDRILGYGAGADDYLAKPFNPSELIARVRALLRRTRRLAKLEARPIETSHLLIDLERREVLVRQDPGSEVTAVELSPIEFDLLHKLASRPRVIFTRTQLLDAVRGEDFVGDERVIDTYVKRIRRQLSSPQDRDRYIKTHRGLGYSFEDVST